MLSTASGNVQNVSASRSPSRNLVFLVKYVSSIQKKNRILLSTECSNNILVNWFLIQASENYTLIRKGCHSLQEHMHNIQQKNETFYASTNAAVPRALRAISGNQLRYTSRCASSFTLDAFLIQVSS